MDRRIEGYRDILIDRKRERWVEGLKKKKDNRRKYNKEEYFDI